MSTADPNVIAAMNACAAALQLADPSTSTWIAGIAWKLTAGLELSDDEAACANYFINFLAAADQAAAAQAAHGTLTAATSTPADTTLTLTSAEAADLAELLARQTDPVLIGIAQSLAGAQA